MEITVDGHCPSCGTELHTTGSFESLSGVGAIRDCSTQFGCGSCGATFTHTHEFDLELLSMSGFHSWVGSIGGETVCIVVDDITVDRGRLDTLVGADSVGEGRVGVDEIPNSG